MKRLLTERSHLTNNMTATTTVILNWHRKGNLWGGAFRVKGECDGGSSWSYSYSYKPKCQNKSTKKDKIISKALNLMSLVLNTKVSCNFETNELCNCCCEGAWYPCEGGFHLVSFISFHWGFFLSKNY